MRGTIIRLPQLYHSTLLLPSILWLCMELEYNCSIHLVLSHRAPLSVIRDLRCDARPRRHVDPSTTYDSEEGLLTTDDEPVINT